MWKCRGFSGRSRRSSSISFIFFFTFQLLLKESGVMGQVVCYNCVWRNLPSSEQKNDICRPQNFQPETVHQDMCLHGCTTTILYEYDPETPTTTTIKPAQKKNGTSKPPMTFFFRGCPQNDVPRSKTGCEAKSYQNVQQEECFCTSNLCNGNHGSGSLSPSWIWILMLTFILARNSHLFIDFTLITHPTNLQQFTKNAMNSISISSTSSITSGRRSVCI